MSSISRLGAYLVCAIPAAIGVWFVAHFAYTTSDTPTDAYNSAFLYAMIALGAYACPALALAIGKRNRAGAAFFWLAALLAIAVNWSNTLGAISNRGAGVEAERSKAADTAREGKQRLSRIEKHLEQLPPVSVPSAAVSAAEAAVKAAERVRMAECDKRGPLCRTRENEEQDLRKALAKVLADKGQSDQRASLTTEANAIRARLTDAPAVKEGNTLGTALGRLMPGIDANTASTAQQGLMSLIVEILIAAFLALPELLTGPHRTPKRVGNVTEVTPLAIAAPAKPQLIASVTTKAGSVPEIMADLLQPAKSSRVEIEEAFLAYVGACKERSAGVMAPEQFIDPLRRFCKACSIPTISRGGKVFLMGVRLAGNAEKPKGKRLGSMGRKP